MNLKSINFNQYSTHQPITVEDLQKLTQEDSNALIARAEFSGSEGRYIEVCRWNEQTNRYERFCFEKVFGGELGDDRNAVETAIAIAEQISPLTTDHKLIHSMSAWSEKQNAPSSETSPDQKKGVINIKGDPLFINPTTNLNSANFSLQNGSPAIAAGSANNCAETYFDGTSRNGSCTLGAFPVGS